MGKIYYVMGKSAVGKDTVFKELMKQRPDLRTVVMYTTRPIREEERDGVEYHFTTGKRLEEFCKAGTVIELRTYQTVLGPWSYFTVDDGQIDLSGKQDYLMIGTLESYEKMRSYFGEKNIVPIYLEIPDGIRLMRSLEREKHQKNPNYREICRRYLADEEDFSEEKLKALQIEKRFSNLDLRQCIEEILNEL